MGCDGIAPLGLVSTPETRLRVPEWSSGAKRRVMSISEMKRCHFPGLSLVNWHSILFLIGGCNSCPCVNTHGLCLYWLHDNWFDTAWLDSGCGKMTDFDTGWHGWVGDFWSWYVHFVRRSFILKFLKEQWKNVSGQNWTMFYNFILIACKIFSGSFTK